MLAFASFRLKLGTRHFRWGFSWDGKENFLTVSGPYAPLAGRAAPPVSGKTEHLAPSDLDAPFRFIEGVER